MIGRCLIITARDPRELRGGDIERLKTLIHFYGLKYEVDLIVTGSGRKSSVRCNLGSTTCNLRYVKNTIFNKMLGVILALLKGRSLQQGIYANKLVVKKINKILLSNAYKVTVIHLFRNYSNEIKFSSKYVHFDLCDCQSYNYLQVLDSKHVSYVKKLIYKYELAKTIKVEKLIAANDKWLISFINRHDSTYFAEKYLTIRSMYILPNYFNIDKSARYYPGNKFAIVGNFKSYHNKQMLKIICISPVFGEIKDQLLIIGQIGILLNMYLKLKGLKVVRNPRSVIDEISQCSFGLSFLEFNSGFQTKLIDYANASLLPIVSANVASGADLTPNKDCLVINSIEDILSLNMISSSYAERLIKNFISAVQAKSEKCQVSWRDFLEQQSASK